MYQMISIPKTNIQENSIETCELRWYKYNCLVKHEEIWYLNTPIMISEIESIKSLQPKKNPGTDNFFVEF